MNVNLRNKLSEVKLIIIYEMLMISGDLFYNVYTRLIDIHMCCNLESFARLSVVVLRDFMKLPPFRGKPTLCKF